MEPGTQGGLGQSGTRQKPLPFCGVSVEDLPGDAHECAEREADATGDSDTQALCLEGGASAEEEAAQRRDEPCSAPRERYRLAAPEYDGMGIRGFAQGVLVSGGVAGFYVGEEGFAVKRTGTKDRNKQTTNGGSGLLYNGASGERPYTAVQDEPAQ